MKIRPLNDWAVVIPSEAAVRTAGGLFIPDAAKEKPAEGTLEAIGPGAYEEEKRGEKKKEKKERKFVPTSVKPGERVMYDRFAGQKITVDGKERVLVREKNILGILPPKPADPKEDLPPLMLPAMTSTVSSTALVARKTTAVLVKKEAQKKGQGAGGRGQVKAKPAAKKKAVKKAAVKPKKTTAKKTAAKKAKKKR